MRMHMHDERAVHAVSDRRLYDEGVVRTLVAIGNVELRMDQGLLMVKVDFWGPSTLRGIVTNCGEALVAVDTREVVHRGDQLAYIADELMYTLRHKAHDAGPGDYREAIRRLLVANVDRLRTLTRGIVTGHAAAALRDAPEHAVHLGKRPRTPAYRRADGRPLNPPAEG